jgi:hypothetical protein
VSTIGAGLVLDVRNPPASQAVAPPVQDPHDVPDRGHGVSRGADEPDMQGLATAAVTHDRGWSFRIGSVAVAPTP